MFPSPPLAHENEALAVGRPADARVVARRLTTPGKKTIQALSGARGRTTAGGWSEPPRAHPHRHDFLRPHGRERSKPVGRPRALRTELTGSSSRSRGAPPRKRGGGLTYSGSIPRPALATQERAPTEQDPPDAHELSAVFFPGVVERRGYNSGIKLGARRQALRFHEQRRRGKLRSVRARARRPRRARHDRPGEGRTRGLGRRPTTGSHSSPAAAARATSIFSTFRRRPPPRLTHGERPYLYPQWSPDGKRLAFIQGTNENHDVAVLEPGRTPPALPRALSTWPHDRSAPAWSPDGKRTRVLHQLQRGGRPQGLARSRWFAADGSDPPRVRAWRRRVVATDVVPDVERGPAWLPRQPPHRVRARRKTGVLPRSTSPTSRSARARSCARNQDEPRRHLLARRPARVPRAGRPVDQVYVAKLKEPKP